MEAGDEPIAPIGSDPAKAGIGDTLRARRLELGLSQADIATMVKLPVRRIDAIEQERWGELPEGPYLRGFLRNIARVLNLDAALLVDRVEGAPVRAVAPERRLVPPGSTHVTLPRRSGPADDRRGGRPLVFGAFLFASIAALIAWSGTDSFDRTMVVAKSWVGPRDRASAVAGGAPGAAVDPAPRVAAAPATVGAPPSDNAPAVETAAPSPGPTAATPSTAATSALALLFRFNEESWVEVRSADGKVLLQRLNAAGSEQQVQGEAPYSLVVGNAKGVSLQFRGQPVDLAPYTRDSVARFKLS